MWHIHELSPTGIGLTFEPRAAKLATVAAEDAVSFDSPKDS